MSIEYDKITEKQLAVFTRIIMKLTTEEIDSLDYYWQHELYEKMLHILKCALERIKRDEKNDAKP